MICGEEVSPPTTHPHGRAASLGERRIHGASLFVEERRLLRRWSDRCQSLNCFDTLAACGLTAAASPPTLLGQLYDQGEDQEELGYYDELPEPPDQALEQTTEFMEWYEVLAPTPHRALLARHRRLVDGRIYTNTPEWRLALSLYQLGPVSHLRLAEHCEIGYGALQRWLREWQRREGIEPRTERFF
jgi:hypothetical protein